MTAKLLIAIAMSGTLLTFCTGCGAPGPTTPDANGVYWDRGPEGWEKRVQNPDGSTRPAKSGPVGGQFSGS